MHDKLVFTAGILLESYQLTDATQLGYKPFKISDFTSISLNLHYWEYMITLPLSKYYFISTVITTTNQRYHIKHVLQIYSTIIAILRLCL